MMGDRAAGRAPRELDCFACKSPLGLEATSLPALGWVVRLIGYGILLPSIAAVGFALYIVVDVHLEWARNGWPDAYSGSPFGDILGLVIATFLGIGGAAFAVPGWILSRGRRVYRCAACGYTMDRSTRPLTAK